MEFSLEVEELKKNIDVLLKGKKHMMKWKKKIPPKMIIRANNNDGVLFEFGENAASFPISVKNKGDVAVSVVQ